MGIAAPLPRQENGPQKPNPRDSPGYLGPSSEETPRTGPSNEWLAIGG